LNGLGLNEEQKSERIVENEGSDANVLEGSTTSRLLSLEDLLAKIASQCERIERESELRARESKKIATLLARQMAYRLDDNEAKIEAQSIVVQAHEGRLDRLEEQASQNTFIFGDINYRLTELEKTGTDGDSDGNALKRVAVTQPRERSCPDGLSKWKT